MKRLDESKAGWLQQAGSDKIASIWPGQAEGSTNAERSRKEHEQKEAPEWKSKAERQTRREHKHTTHPKGLLENAKLGSTEIMVATIELNGSLY